MQKQKEKITLSKANETLLITLYCKAQVTRSSTPFLVDQKAVEILDQVDYDFKALRVTRGTILTVPIRAKRMDEYVHQFISKNPGGTVLHLGCGLDSRCQRAGDPAITWYDLDMPAVIDLRRKFFDETEWYHMIASSVNDWSWLDSIHAGDQPVMIVAEGLTMYLTEVEMKELILRLKASFPNSRLVFDAYSTFTISKAHNQPSLKRTGAVVHWGLDDPHELETWAPGIKLVEEWYFNQSSDIPMLTWSDRFLFWISGKFEIARRAHRVLYYQFIQ